MFDVFLSYNSADRQGVGELAETLRARGLSIWLDSWNLIPGTPWQHGLAEGIAGSRSAVVFIGPSGIGPWENAETSLLLDRAFRDTGFRVMPVLLPGAPDHERVKIPPFLKLFSWVDLRGGFHDAAVAPLLAGIRGVPPGAPAGESPGAAGPTEVRPEAASRLALAGMAAGLAKAGASPEIGERIADHLQRPVEDYLQGAGDRSIADLSAAIAELRLSGELTKQAQRYFREWAAFVSPNDLLSWSFYVSTSRINRVYTAVRDRLAGSAAAGLPADEPHERFAEIHRLFLREGRLVFLPSQQLASEDVVWDRDSLYYFNAPFALVTDDVLRPVLTESRDATDHGSVSMALTHRILNDPDPYFCPFLALEGRIGELNISVSLSRKFIAVDSSTISALGVLLSGEPVGLFGVAAISDQQGEITRLEPLLLSFSSHRGWAE